MSDHFFMIREYINYRLKAMGRHGMHSPFVYEFIEKVIRDKSTHPSFEAIEAMRKQMYQNQISLQVEDFGAGSHKNNSNQRKVCDIARHAGRKAHWGQLLFKMVRHFQSKHILELGTSMGLGTSYLSAANPNGKVVSIEGSPEIAQQAMKHFKQMRLENIECRVGNFDLILEQVLEESQPFDFIFIDGNHRHEPTVRYFKQCLSHIHENTVIVFDDIHWSPGMAKAWEEIKSATEVTLSLDLFYFGIVFFRKEFLHKQDFVLRYS